MHLGRGFATQIEELDDRTNLMRVLFKTARWFDIKPYLFKRMEATRARLMASHVGMTDLSKLDRSFYDLACLSCGRDAVMYLKDKPSAVPPLPPAAHSIHPFIAFSLDKMKQIQAKNPSNRTMIQYEDLVREYLLEEPWKKGPTDRPNRAGGGTCILVHKSVKHHEVMLPTLTHTEATAVKLEIDGSPVTLISVYSPPGRVSARDLDLLLTSDNRVIIAGDLNSKSEMWGCRKTNTTGRILYQHSLKNDYVILAPRTPTHLSNGGLSDILDRALIKGINLNATPEVVCQ
ncbi:hypothetical protein AAG570_005825 [Ranatra chinensis]|uniref:Endonuclease/exonuclease/phosphatase domain-containing protein n=1 Tax=Ranatra chinensis TaxID=642074 RepID=A0ABD0YM74_9HEMI